MCKLGTVNFEQAKKLKELGFDYECMHHFDLYKEKSCEDGKTYHYSGELVENFNKYEDLVSAPTLELVAKWLRKEKNIHLIVEPACKDGDAESHWMYSCSMVYNDEISMSPNAMPQDCTFYDYEDALSYGIDIAMKLSAID